MTNLSAQNVIKMASKCLNCKNAPCTKACPVATNVPKFLQLLKDGEVTRASSVITANNPFGAICGAVCPHEKQCQGACVRGIKGEPVQIGTLESFAVANGLDKLKPTDTTLCGKTVAIVGSGVAGLTCATYLAQKGATVTVYEAQSTIGGVVATEIPTFRLNKDYLTQLIYAVKQLGVQFKLGVCVGIDVTLLQLSATHDAVFVATGLMLDGKVGIEGENLVNVVGGKAFLQSPTAGGNVIVIGGGNVAMDCARTAKRLGANVTVAYRRGYNQMPACEKEKQDALAEGVTFSYLLAPQKVNGNNAVSSVTFEEMALGEAGADGRASIVPTGKTQTLPCDTLIVATGSTFDSTVLCGTDIKVERGRVVVNEQFNAGGNLFFGGDATNKQGTVVWAVKEGKLASQSIANFLTNKE